MLNLGILRPRALIVLVVFSLCALSGSSTAFAHTAKAGNLGIIYSGDDAVVPDVGGSNEMNRVQRPNRGNFTAI